LPAVLDALAEDSIFVANAVAEERQAERGPGIHDARRQAAETTVSETGVPLLLVQHFEVEPDAAHCMRAGVVRAEIDDVVDQRAAEQELQRQVIHTLGVSEVIRALGLEPSIGQPVAHGIRERLIDIEIGGGVFVLRHRVLHAVGKSGQDAVGVEAARRDFGDVHAGH
jgi:hypothetical protein